MRLVEQDMGATSKYKEIISRLTHVKNALNLTGYYEKISAATVLVKHSEKNRWRIKKQK